MIGISAISVFFKVRISLVAVYPSISGIWISIRTRSYCPGSESATASTASIPSFTLVTSTPASSNIAVTISLFSSLSSASRTFVPFISKSVLREAAASRALCLPAPVHILSCSVTTNSVPASILLFTEIVPPIMSTIFFVIAIPRPVP